MYPKCLQSFNTHWRVLRTGSLLIDGDWEGGGGGGQATQNNFCSARTAKKQIVQRVPCGKQKQVLSIVQILCLFVQIIAHRKKVTHKLEARKLPNLPLKKIMVHPLCIQKAN